MEGSLTQKEKIAAAKKKLRKFQQKTARLDRKLSENGSHEADTESQYSDVVPAIHQQTIDILVEEKAELLKKRDKQHSVNQQQQDEISVLKSQLYSTNAELNSSEKKHASLNNQHNTLSAKYAEKERDAEKLLKQVNNLNEQMSVLQTELSALTSERNELNERLSAASAANTSTPQIHNDMSSVPNPFKRNSEVIRLEEEVDVLRGELEARTTALRNKELQYDTLAGRATHQTTQFNTQISALEKAVEERNTEVTELLQKIDTLTVQNLPDISPLQLELSALPSPTAPTDTTTSHTADIAHRDAQIAQLAADKGKLEQALEEQIVQTMSVQKLLDQFKETHVDQNVLLTQINNDKATISRAMGQNKQLKEHMIDLQDKLLKTSDTNATLANEVQQLSAHTQQLQSQLNLSISKQESLRQQLSAKDTAQQQRPHTEDSVLPDNTHKQLQAQVKQLNEKVAGLQQEKAIMGLSAAQVESVKAMNVALQEKVSSLSQQLETGKSPREVELEERIEVLDKQYNSVAVDSKIQSMLTNERLEREKQREFLDKYYEDRLSEQVDILEERIATQTKQFKKYIEEVQVTHEDEVEALRTQLSDLQQNFRTSLHTQYTQLVQYFTHKGVTDLKSREEELHTHYMAELSRLYSEMTQQLQHETEEIRTRKRTQSDELSIYTVDDPVVEEAHKDWEAEKQNLQSTIEHLEEELVKIEISDGEESDIEDTDTIPEKSKEERKLHARINVLEMQLNRARTQNDQNTQRYKQEIQRQTLVIQKLHMYLSTQHYETSTTTTHDNYADDNISITSAGQFNQTQDLSSTKDTVERIEQVTEAAVTEPAQSSSVPAEPLQTSSAPPEPLQNGLQNTYTIQEKEFDTKLKYLLSKVPEGGQYVQHMQKLQDKFATVMKDNANLHEKLKDFEHQNALLECETDTIGEYISLYQSQRKALRMQFQQKDNFINQILTERSDMQTHIVRLQQLITDLPCVDDDARSTTHDQSTFTRERSNSISSNISNLSIMSSTRDEMLDIINKIKVKKRGPVEGPLLAGGSGPIRDM